MPPSPTEALSPKPLSRRPHRRPQRRLRAAVVVAKGAEQRRDLRVVLEGPGLAREGDRASDLLDVAIASRAGGHVRLEARTLGLGKRAVEVLGDELDELLAGQIAVHLGLSRERRRRYTSPS